MFDSSTTSSSLTNNSISGYSLWFKQSSRLRRPHGKGIFQQTQLLKEWHQMAPEVVSPTVIPAPRQLPRRLTPMQSESLRPPPPTPDCRLRSALWTSRPEDDRAEVQRLKTKSTFLSIAAFPFGTGGRAKRSLPAMPAREMPPLRRSQGVALPGCPCCRRYREMKPESLMKLKS